MADTRFFQVAGPCSLGELARLAGAELSDPGLAERMISDVAPLQAAGPGDLSFLDNKQYLDRFEGSKAGACIVDPRYAERAPAGMALLLTPTPYRAYALVAARFYPNAPAVGGIHPTAVVDPSARLGRDVVLGPYVVVGPRAELGDRVVAGPHVVIEAGVVVGEATEIGPGAYLSHCLVGRECLIHSGVRLGNRGFGFTLDRDGYIDVPQLGRVIVEDRVEIGANSTVDRGAGPDTVIGAGTKIDNLIQIGHNVQVGRGCVLVAQSGVAGSSKLEDFVMVGAQGGIAGHLTIGRGAQVAAQSGVMRDVAPGSAVCGAPAIPIKDFFRLAAIWQQQVKARKTKQ